MSLCKIITRGWRAIFFLKTFKNNECNNIRYYKFSTLAMQEIYFNFSIANVTAFLLIQCPTSITSISCLTNIKSLSCSEALIVFECFENYSNVSHLRNITHGDIAYCSHRMYDPPIIPISIHCSSCEPLLSNCSDLCSPLETKHFYFW